MDKSTCSLKTYHAKIDKLQCWEKKPFYATYAPRIRIEDHDTQPVIERVVTYRYTAERAIAILVATILILLALGVFLCFFIL